MRHSAGSIDQTLEPYCKGTIYKNRSKVIFLTQNYKIKVKKQGYLIENFGPALCRIARDLTLQTNISANSNETESENI
jgi:hypothetical protein